MKKPKPPPEEDKLFNEWVRQLIQAAKERMLGWEAGGCLIIRKVI